MILTQSKRTRSQTFPKFTGIIRDITVSQTDTKVSITKLVNLYDFYYLLEYENKQKNLRFVKIYFDTPVFDKVTKDRAAKFADMLSAIGGTMGLLTGFSMLSAVEIIYFAGKIIIGIITKKNVIGRNKLN